MRMKSHVNNRDAQLEPEVLKARIARFRQVQAEIVTQVRRVIVGQEEVLEQVMIAPVRRRPLPDHRPARHRQDAAGAHHGADAGPGVQAHPVHARPDAQRHHRHRHHRRGPGHRPPHLDLRARARSSPTSCWPTKSTARRPRRRAALLEAMQELACTVRGNQLHAAARRSSCWPRRTPSSWKAPTRCPKRSSTASCSTRCSITSSADEELKVVDLTTTTQSRRPTR